MKLNKSKKKEIRQVKLSDCFNKKDGIGGMLNIHNVVINNKLTNMKMYSNILVGYGFDQESGPYFTIDDISNPTTIRKHLSILDVKVNLCPIFDEKLCIGTYDLFSKNTYPCPFKKKLSLIVVISIVINVMKRLVSIQGF
ncbi:hypothetical protein [Cardinium endosymbiont of Culicoides punctatus]|uniref:hypothetical protein n=1 Tax=Cardinium endosymbiont of Culicoides punctatus TaxID=2304601 RepID=UPI001058E9D1|nr:hypothetical protein [Cardinium endosymbiont of Culicoides punctatus]TDG95000.1 hypothetical protein CCPUN_06570 [Cardinium endosymbiont of Culicoides punctatus]